MKEKEELIEEMKTVFPIIPQDMGRLLNMLTHPSLIEYTKRYINSMDVANKCQNYLYPWSCAKEAEARYENIKYGWLGAGSGVGYEDWWCEPCRRRVMGGE